MNALMLRQYRRHSLEALGELFPCCCPYATDRLRHRPLGQPQRSDKLRLGPAIDQHAARYVDGLLPDLQPLDGRLELGFGLAVSSSIAPITLHTRFVEQMAVPAANHVQKFS